MCKESPDGEIFTLSVIVPIRRQANNGVPTRATWNVTTNVDKSRILIAEHHPVMRDGLQAVIEQDADMTVVGEVATGEMAIEAFGALAPDVVLMDAQLKDQDVLATIMAIRKASPTAALVVMSTYPGEPLVRRALSLGATSCFLKTATGEEIIEEIRRARALAAMGR